MFVCNVTKQQIKSDTTMLSISIEERTYGIGTRSMTDPESIIFFHKIFIAQPFLWRKVEKWQFKAYYL